MWIYPDEMSKWALDQIKKGKMNRSAKELITDSKYAYAYCRDVEDDPDVRRMINEPKWVYNYCKYIRDDHKMALKIWDPTYLEKYLLKVKQTSRRKANWFVTFYCLIVVAVLLPLILAWETSKLIVRISKGIAKWVR